MESALSSWRHMREERDDSELDMGKLYMHAFQGKWEKVVKLYETRPEVWNAEITSSEDTALHMAINEDKEDVVVRLVEILAEAHGGDRWYERDAEEALRKANEVADTPLHRAAARWSVTRCKCVVEAGNKMDADLLRITNEWGETPIFVAALDNRKHAFIFLFRKAQLPKDELLRSPLNGETVLYSATRREHYDLAFHIMRLCPYLVARYNEERITPLHILASKSSAFRSGNDLPWWRAIIDYGKYAHTPTCV
ncbi:uncharacterized protein LOC114720636 [Neltuma alba]|uniref:uncharacterized protein LOC114720636 n=1 Tax=Neltuma alba TaxID=207710 RepID=UPI0010A43A44|nr:uncharacterized protein LOC114720636 [Prosopis alba]